MGDVATLSSEYYSVSSGLIEKTPFVSDLRRAKGLLEDKLADPHSRLEDDRKMAMVYQLKLNRTSKTGVDRRSGDMDTETESRQ